MSGAGFGPECGAGLPDGHIKHRRISASSDSKRNRRQSQRSENR